MKNYNYFISKVDKVSKLRKMGLRFCVHQPLMNSPIAVCWSKRDAKLIRDALNGVNNEPRMEGEGRVD